MLANITVSGTARVVSDRRCTEWVGWCVCGGVGDRGPARAHTEPRGGDCSGRREGAMRAPTRPDRHRARERGRCARAGAAAAAAGLVCSASPASRCTPQRRFGTWRWTTHAHRRRSRTPVASRVSVRCSWKGRAWGRSLRRVRGGAAAAGRPARLDCLVHLCTSGALGLFGALNCVYVTARARRGTPGTHVQVSGECVRGGSSALVCGGRPCVNVRSCACNRYVAVAAGAVPKLADVARLGSHSGRESAIGVRRTRGRRALWFCCVYIHVRPPPLPPQVPCATSRSAAAATCKTAWGARGSWTCWRTKSAWGRPRTRPSR